MCLWERMDPAVRKGKDKGAGTGQSREAELPSNLKRIVDTRGCGSGDGTLVKRSTRRRPQDIGWRKDEDRRNRK